MYGDERSESLIAQVKKSRKEKIIVATKGGRHLPRQTVEGYSRENLTLWVEDSLRNHSADVLDLLQLHCPTTAVYDRPEIFGMLDDLVQAGKIGYYGVSGQTIEEALKAITHPNVQTVQIIFNCFPQRPAEFFFSRAKQRKVGFLARVPLGAAYSRASVARTRLSLPTTGGTSIVTGNHLTWARLFPVWTTR